MVLHRHNKFYSSVNADIPSTLKCYTRVTLMKNQIGPAFSDFHCLSVPVGPTSSAQADIWICLSVCVVLFLCVCNDLTHEQLPSCVFNQALDDWLGAPAELPTYGGSHHECLILHWAKSNAGWNICTCTFFFFPISVLLCYYALNRTCSNPDFSVNLLFVPFVRVLSCCIIFFSGTRTGKEDRQRTNRSSLTSLNHWLQCRT